MSLRTVAIAASAFAGAALLSFGWSEQGTLQLSVDSAQARVGRPLTPMSGAGVARRNYRRAAYGTAGAVGAGVAGAAALGTAAAVAATSPGWGPGPYYGARPYYGGAYSGTVDARASYGGPGYYPAPGPAPGPAVAPAVAATSPNWGWGTGPYGGRPYYGGAYSGTFDARASYGGPWGGVSSSDRDLYFKNLHDSGYDPKNNFNANGTIKG
jgi:hypothetical protein